MSSKIMDQLSFALKKTLGIYEEKQKHRVQHPNVLWDLSSTQDLDSNQKHQSGEPSQGSQNCSSRIESETMENSEGEQLGWLRELFMEHKQKCYELKNFQQSKMAYQSQIEQLTQQVFEQESVVKENKRLNDYIKRSMLENNKLTEEILAMASKNWIIPLSMQQQELMMGNGELIDQLTLENDQLETQNRALKMTIQQIRAKLEAAHKAHSIQIKLQESVNGKLLTKSSSEELKLQDQVDKLYQENRQLRYQLYLQKEQQNEYYDEDEEQDEEKDTLNDFFMVEMEKINNVLKKETELRLKFQLQNQELQKRIPIILDELSVLAKKVSQLNELEKQHEDLLKKIGEISLENQNLKKQASESNLNNDQNTEKIGDLDQKSVDKISQKFEEIINNQQTESQKAMSSQEEGSPERVIEKLRGEVQRLNALLEQRNKTIKSLESRVQEKDQKLIAQQTEKNNYYSQLKRVLDIVQPNPQMNMEQFLEEVKNKVGTQGPQNIFKKSSNSQQEEIMKLQAENKNLQNQIESVKLQKSIDMEQIRNNNAKLKQAIQQQNQKYQVLNSQHLKLQEEYRAISNKKKHLQCIINELQVEFDRLKSCIVRLKEQRKIILAHNQQLRNSLQECMSKPHKSHPKPISSRN